MSDNELMGRERGAKMLDDLTFQILDMLLSDAQTPEAI